MGGRIKQCEVYPDMFCELVCRETVSERDKANGGVDDRDVTAEMNFLMSLEAMSLGALDSPHDADDRGI